MEKNFAYLVGAYLGDGHVYYSKQKRGSSHQFSIVSEDRDFCRICSDIVKEKFSKGGTITKIDNYYKLVVCSKALCTDILALTCGNDDYYMATAEEKKEILPDWEDIDCFKEFIKGLMDSDGWIREAVNGRYLKYEIGFKNTAPWTEQIYEIMQDRLKLSCGKLYKTTIDRCKPSLSWTINPQDYHKNLGFRIKRKSELLEKYKSSRSKNTTRRKSNVIVRFSDQEKSALDKKSSVLGISNSELLRKSAWSFWSNGEIDADKCLTEFHKADDAGKEDIVELVFRYYRVLGYPYHKLSGNQMVREMNKLCNTPSPILEDNHLQINTVGLGACNSFHRHMFKVKCRYGFLTPWNLFSNDDKLRSAIRRWMELGKKPSHAGIRRILRTRDGVQSVVNFKPSIARFFYDKYCPSNGKVLDPCAGYGARLMGAIASNKGILYHGIDPEGATAIGNVKMAAFFQNVYQIDRTFDFSFRFDLGCSERVMLGLHSYDVVFTSPPYFNVEKYSDSPDQSCVKYNTYEKWKAGFLEPVIYSAFTALKPEGYFIWNIKNYKEMPLADDSLKLAEKVGFKLIDTYHMRMSNSDYRRAEGNNWHAEPIFVFKK